LHNNGTAEIFSYSRDTTLGYRVFKELNLCELQEEEGRMATTI
jgi:hypothetical protein